MSKPWWLFGPIKWIATKKSKKQKSSNQGQLFANLIDETNPDDWECDPYSILHKPSGLMIWVANRPYADMHYSFQSSINSIGVDPVRGKKVTRKEAEIMRASVDRLMIRKFEKSINKYKQQYDG